MKRRISLITAVSVVLIGQLVAPCSLRADGGPFPPKGHRDPVDMPGQRAIIVFDNEQKHEDLILSVKLLGAPEAAWVVPVPSMPDVDTASVEWFTALRRLTEPDYLEFAAPKSDQAGGGPEAEGERKVTLLMREQVGVYDVSTLSASDPQALSQWLNQHGYAFPPEGVPLVEAYVQEGWYFVATRVLPEESSDLEGDVQPLWLSFDAQRPVYPMRLTALVEGDLNVLVYVLADQRMAFGKGNFGTEFAGELQARADDDLFTFTVGDDVDLRLPGRYRYGGTVAFHLEEEEKDLAEVIAGASYLTRLHDRHFDAGQVLSDLYLHVQPRAFVAGASIAAATSQQSLRDAMLLRLTTGGLGLVALPPLGMTAGTAVVAASTQSLPPPIPLFPRPSQRVGLDPDLVLAFRWDGVLLGRHTIPAEQSYQVRLYQPESGTQLYSRLTSGTELGMSLPDETGLCCWWVRVIEDGRVIASSSPRYFYLVPPEPEDRSPTPSP